MRKRVALALAIFLCLLLAGCSKPPAPAVVPSPSPYSKSDFREIWKRLSGPSRDEYGFGEGLKSGTYLSTFLQYHETPGDVINVRPRRCQDIVKGPMYVNEPFTVAEAESSHDLSERGSFNPIGNPPTMMRGAGNVYFNFVYSVDGRLFASPDDAATYMAHIQKLLPSCSQMRLFFPGSTDRKLRKLKHGLLLSLTRLSLNVGSLPTIAFSVSKFTKNNDEVILAQYGNIVFLFNPMLDPAKYANPDVAADLQIFDKTIENKG